MATVCESVSLTPEKIKTVPIKPAVIAPSGLNACEKLSLRSLDPGDPNSAINGLAAVSRNDNPLAITNCAMRKSVYWPACAAGKNIQHPRSEERRVGKECRS